jgi:uncharacterized protein (TIGR02118 family)
MIKLTVLYSHPTNPEAFEDYDVNKQMPFALKMTGFTRAEIAKFLNQPDGSKAPCYRGADFVFGSAAVMQKTMDSPEGKAAGADIPNIATGGVTFIACQVG